uniref:Multidrug and toxin extrusion protein n=1 Tax=Amphiprion ocellaris TaxID=80972 RepID=A0AAQ6AE18_AMPOC
MLFSTPLFLHLFSSPYSSNPPYLISNSKKCISKLFRCACVRRWLPLAYREELYQVLLLTGPLLLSRILHFLLQFVISIFCGHIGNAELAGYALATATVNVTTSATGYGLALACDTLISQTYGGKNMKRVGVILQRSSLILLLFCVPCWGLLINSQNLLLLMHQEEEVTRIANYGFHVFFFICQGIILPQMYTAAAANILNLLFNYVLIFSLEMGVTGSAIASSLSQITICLLLFGYIRWKKLHLQTWGGWTTDCLQEWGSYMKLAIPSAFMICFEWWIWEVGGFLAGLLGEVDLAAQHIMLTAQTNMWCMQFPLGVHAAACVRVGNALGAGDTERVKVTCKVALALSGVLAVFQGIVLAGSKSVIGYIFTSDPNIVEIVSESLTVYIFVQFFDALLCVCAGILIGSGMQKIAAFTNLVGYYCIGLPVGIALMFKAKLRILGLWLGIAICSFIQTGFFLFLIFKLNWKKVTYKVGCSCLSLKSHAIFGHFDSHINIHVHIYMYTTVQKFGDAEQSKNTKPVKLLSVNQLILRRGLTLLVTVLILAVGVAFHIAFPPPEPSAQGWANVTLNFTSDSTPTPLASLNLTQNV